MAAVQRGWAPVSAGGHRPVPDRRPGSSAPPAPGPEVAIAPPRHGRPEEEPPTLPLQLPRQRGARTSLEPLPPLRVLPSYATGSPTAFDSGQGQGGWRARSASRRRLLVPVLAVLLLAAAVAAGWWWYSSTATPTASDPSAVAARTTGPETVAGSAPALGPTLMDARGAALPSAARAGAQRVYAALAANDTVTLASLYTPGPGAAPWATVAARLSRPAVRDGLLAALRTPATRPAEVAYLYTSNNYGVGLRTEGTVAFYGTGQTTPAARASSSTGAVRKPEPTLGAAAWSPGSQGYGQVRPSVANANGDGTSVVDNLHWRTWGGPTATASGTASWVPPDGASSDGIETPAVVIASDLGDCHGHLAYRKIGWYFPSRGETPAAAQNGYPDICDPL